MGIRNGATQGSPPRVFLKIDYNMLVAFLSALKGMKINTNIRPQFPRQRSPLFFKEFPPSKSIR